MRKGNKKMFVINELSFQDIEAYDVFNYNNTHSYEEDDNYNYNCMAYAFGAFEWLSLIDMDYDSPEAIIEELNLSLNNTMLYNEIEDALNNYDFNNHFLRKVMVKRMLNAFPDLRIVSSFEKLKEDEYGISFATGYDDFHFLKYDNGKFSHKQGTLPIKNIKNEEEGFHPRYNSKIIRFAMKKKPIKFIETF